MNDHHGDAFPRLTESPGVQETNVVIVNFNAGDLLGACIRAVLDSSAPVRVVLVDNGSSDGSIDAVRGSFAGEPRLVIVENGRNLGFAAACNIGLDRCSETDVLFLNPDCLIRPDTIEVVRKELNARPDCGMAGCLLLNPEGTEQAGCRRAIPTPWRSLVRVLRLSRWFPNNPRFRSFTLHHDRLPEAPIDVEAISGAFMYVRRRTFERVGRFDEGYFMHCEDLDWCMRIRETGMKILFVPGTVAVHAKGHCSANRLVRVEWHKHCGMVRFYRKFFWNRYPVGLKFLVVPAVWLRFAVKAVVLTARGHTRTGSSAQERPLVVPSLTVSDQVTEETIVFGASSRIGAYLLPMLEELGCEVVAISRRIVPHSTPISRTVTWIEGDVGDVMGRLDPQKPRVLFYLAPIDGLHQRIAHFASLGVRRLVAFSSTSLQTKRSSAHPRERSWAATLEQCEQAIADVCREYGIAWTIFRPTLIYGGGDDKFVGSIVRFITRLGFFPVVGKARGLRQPLHARDAAIACLAVRSKHCTFGRIYDLSGGEVLEYRDMIARIFRSLGKTPRIFAVSRWSVGLALRVAHAIGTYRELNTSMAERMDTDMCFDHSAATRDFGFVPQDFDPREALRAPRWFEKDARSSQAEIPTNSEEATKGLGNLPRPARPKSKRTSVS